MIVPESLKPLGMAVAVLLVALLIAGELGVPYRGMHPSEDYDQSRTHWNTKSTTRFGVASRREIAARVSQILCSATDPVTGWGNQPLPDRVIRTAGRCQPSWVEVCYGNSRSTAGGYVIHRHTRASLLGALVLVTAVHVFQHAVPADGRDRKRIAYRKEGLPWNRTTGQ